MKLYQNEIKVNTVQRWLFVAYLILIFPSHAKGSAPSLYLPIKTDPLFELELERLASLAKLPKMKKPYHLNTINLHLEKIKASHPKLFYRILNYTKKYSSSNISHLTLATSVSNGTLKNIPNQRGRTSDSLFSASLASHFELGSNTLINIGGTVDDSNRFIPNFSYLSFGNEFIQADLGYKEHWLAPHHESALLLSTQAEPLLNLSINNSTPISDWNVMYELSVGILSSHNNIKLGDELHSGQPGLLLMHTSFQPTERVTIGLNRTLMFGGGKRNISPSDIWSAITDPVNSDNCGGSGTKLQDCDQEVGNQLASLAVKFDLALFDYPFSLFYEYAGEDTKDHNNYELGNIARNIGLFIPYLNEDMSLYLEQSTFFNQWYVHHLYGEGYSNRKVKMGHWWGMEKSFNDNVGGETTTVRFNWDFISSYHLSAIYRTVKNDTSLIEDYHRSHEFEFSISSTALSGILGTTIYLGRDTYGEAFTQFGISYTW